MGERTPLPSSVTQPLSGEVSPVAASHKALNPKYERQRRYAKTEKGKKATREAEKRWKRKTGKTKGDTRSEGVRLWWQRRKEQQSKEQ